MKWMDLSYDNASSFFHTLPLCLFADIARHRVSNAITSNGRLPNHFINSKCPAAEGYPPGIVEVIVNVYHGTAGVLYVVVDAVVVPPTICLSISSHRLEPPEAVPGNVQFFSRVLKEREESGTLWYTQSFFST
jgi:hypothetical protein